MLEHFHVIPKPKVCRIEFTEDQQGRNLYVGSTRYAILILVINQFNAQIFFIISVLYASTCFEHCVLIIRRSKLY